METEPFAEITAYCAPCRMRLSLPISEALRELIRNPPRPFEPVVVVAELLSPAGEAHSIRIIPTGMDARDPGAYVEFAAEHAPYWMQRTWLPVTREEL
jgi:hypothetical protein